MLRATMSHSAPVRRTPAWSTRPATCSRSGHIASERTRYPAPVRAVAGLLQALGAGYLVLSDAMWPEREHVAGRVDQAGVRLTGAGWGIGARNIRAVSELASRYNLRCVFHHHVGTYIETPAEVQRLLESTTEVGLCLDTGHYVYGSGDPVEAVEWFGRRVEYLHFKDVNPTRLGTARCSELDFIGG